MKYSVSNIINNYFLVIVTLIFEAGIKWVCRLQKSNALTFILWKLCFDSLQIKNRRCNFIWLHLVLPLMLEVRLCVLSWIFNLYHYFEHLVTLVWFKKECRCRKGFELNINFKVSFPLNSVNNSSHTISFYLIKFWIEKENYYCHSSFKRRRLTFDLFQILQLKKRKKFQRVHLYCVSQYTHHGFGGFFSVYKSYCSLCF